MVDYKKDPVWVSLRDILNKSNKLYQPNLWEEKAEESELFLKELPKEITFTLTEARKRRKERSVLYSKRVRIGLF